MDTFIQLPPNERRIYLGQAEAMRGLPAAALEKDFWVCWTLRELFQLPEIGEHLIFKGGTSLSKAWGLIERFSEDIDLVIDREMLGFGGDDSPEMAPSKKQRKKRGEALKAACQEFVHDRIASALQDRYGKALTGAGDWKLEPDPDDPDLQTLLFTYPGVFPPASGAYLRPVVKIEMGARSDIWPSEKRLIQAYVAEEFPNLLSDAAVQVQVIQPERTFWEKATLLHEENQRPTGKRRNPRLSRHFYDLWAMIRAGVSERATADLALFERVVEHRQVFFPYTWVDYDTMAKGTLRIVPEEVLIPVWETDYRSMQDVMFFGKPPGFTEILQVVGDFERRFNILT